MNFRNSVTIAKKATCLFPKLRARTPERRELLDRLDQEHAYGERKVRNLQHALLAFEMLGEPRRAALEQVAHEYVHFYLTHMSCEERLILPLAEDALTAEDWGDLDEAFSGNHDGLAGQPAEPACGEMFARISDFMQGARGHTVSCP